MEDYVYYGELYDLYQQLLTDKQRAYFEDYYFQNLSLGEMAENYQVSRNAIFRQLHIVTKKLEEYEKRIRELIDIDKPTRELLQTLIDKMTEMGILKDLPDSNQLSLF